MQCLRVNEKVASRIAFIVNLFALGIEKESKNDQKIIFWDCLQSF